MSLILSKNYDGRTGKGREAVFYLDGTTFVISLTGYDWAGRGLPQDWHGYKADTKSISRTYNFVMPVGLFADYYALNAPLPIRLEWLAEQADATGYTAFAAVAAMLADELANDGKAITGWAAVALSGN